MIAVIDYGVNNLHSIAKALERAVADDSRPAQVCVTQSAQDVAQAERIVLPGVGTFGQGMKALKALPKLCENLELAVKQHQVPFLGICLGMQMMATLGHEFYRCDGLNWLRGQVVPLPIQQVKVPHIGWNDFTPLVQHSVVHTLPRKCDVFFLHSYWFKVDEPRQVLAVTDYGVTIPAIVGHDNLLGFQFHPEKSQGVGLKLLANFIKWHP